MVTLPNCRVGTRVRIWDPFLDDPVEGAWIPTDSYDQVLIDLGHRREVFDRRVLDRIEVIESGAGPA